MVERTDRAHDVIPLVAYVVSSLTLATAWHLKIPYGLWLGNSLAAFVGLFFGIWALKRQSVDLFVHWKRDLLNGTWLGLALVLVTQLGSRFVLLAIPVVHRELAQLYALLDTPPGPHLASPILMLVVLTEELVFRGATTSWLEQRCAKRYVTVLSTVLYVLPLLASGSWLLPFVGLTLGGVWTVARQYTRGLTVPLVSHAWFSLATFVWFPIH